MDFWELHRRLGELHQAELDAVRLKVTDSPQAPVWTGVGESQHVLGGEEMRRDATVTPLKYVAGGPGLILPQVVCNSYSVRMFVGGRLRILK